MLTKAITVLAVEDNETHAYSLRKILESESSHSNVFSYVVVFPFASRASSDFGVMNCEPPQFKQTTIFGNKKMPTLLRLPQWMLISAANSCWLSEPQSTQSITTLLLIFYCPKSMRLPQPLV